MTTTMGTTETGQLRRTVQLDQGNLAELNVLAVNPTHITHVRLTGTRHADQRKLEVFLLSGAVLGVNFEDPDQADLVFEELSATIGRTVPGI